MRNIGVFYILLLSLVFSSCGSDTSVQYNQNTFIPLVKHMEALPAYFPLDHNTKIVCDSNALVLANQLAKDLWEETAMQIPVQIRRADKIVKSKGFICLEMDTSMAGIDAYGIESTAKRISCKAATLKGLRYSMSGLLQMLSKAGVSKAKGDQVYFFPAMRLADEATYAKRTLLSDAAFLTEESAYKKYIDLLSHYKLNTLRIAFPASLWRSDELVSGQRDSIRSLLSKRYAYAKSKGVSLEADINVLDQIAIELAGYHDESVPLDTILYTIETVPVGLAFKEAQAMLDKLKLVFPFEKLHLVAADSIQFLCKSCDAVQENASGISLLDSIQNYMSAQAYSVDYTGYPSEANHSTSMADSIKSFQKKSLIDLNHSIAQLSLETVYDRAREGVTCVISREDIENERFEILLTKRLLAYADRMWSGTNDFRSFEQRLALQEMYLDKMGMDYIEQLTAAQEQSFDSIANPKDTLLLDSLNLISP